jgi:KUP system potassium uptake protein
MESPDILAALYQANENGLEIEPLTASYFVSANTIVRDMYSPLSPWRMKLFRLLHRNALNPTRFFRLPPNRVIEIGRQIQL